MSAGRLRYHAPGAKTPKTPMFRLTFEDGGELVLTEAGKKKRAGVWLFTPEGLEHELAHLGPDALGLGPAELGAILRRERHQLHPLLRDQRAIAGIGRAHANEILWLAKLSPFKMSTDLSDEEIARLAAAIDEDLTRALALRERGRGTRTSIASTAISASPARSATTPSAASRSRSTRSPTARRARRAGRS